MVVTIIGQIIILKAEQRLTPGARYVTLLPLTRSVSETCLQHTQVHP